MVTHADGSIDPEPSFLLADNERRAHRPLVGPDRAGRPDECVVALRLRFELRDRTATQAQDDGHRERHDNE